MRKHLYTIVLLAVLLATFAPIAAAQSPDPEDEECLTYITDRQTIWRAFLESIDDQSTTFGEAYQAYIIVRDGFMLLTPCPATEELHTLTIERTFTYGDFIALLGIAEGELRNRADLGRLAGRLEVELEMLNEEIQAIFEANPAWLALVEE